MGGSPFSKIEIDCLQASELLEAMQFAAKYSLPAVVVHNGLASDAMVVRNQVRGKFKIIAPIDSPRGLQYSTLKFRGMTIDSLESDGFEIVLTPNRSVSETKNEIKATSEFIRTYLKHTNPEIRYVLPSSHLEVDRLAEYEDMFNGIPNPAFIRSGLVLKYPVTKVSKQYNIELVKMINEKFGAAVKLSGNVNNLSDVNSIGASRYAVSLAQARTITKDFLNNLNESEEG